ncbi:hypothetical protein Bpfe_000736 [Biomphalaria pfeifferi]|uniref:Uncharacterized protein n=1 Tax=Biomphalaria pfeifferi TaxID=112525 RepID=A0AAD8FNX1_BIOPF|nr:hypothetical protein Bpfe_000736 [Biomphalaria pfeifferi]
MKCEDGGPRSLRLPRHPLNVEHQNGFSPQLDRTNIWFLILNVHKENESTPILSPEVRPRSSKIQKEDLNFTQI